VGGASLVDSAAIDIMLRPPHRGSRGGSVGPNGSGALTQRGQRHQMPAVREEAGHRRGGSQTARGGGGGGGGGGRQQSFPSLQQHHMSTPMPRPLVQRGAEVAGGTSHQLGSGALMESRVVASSRRSGVVGDAGKGRSAGGKPPASAFGPKRT